MRIFFIMLSFVFFSCGSLRLSQPMTGAASGWPMFGQNSSHMSMSNSVSTGLEKIWDYDVSAGFGDFSPTIANGVVFIGTLKGEVYSFNVKTGDKEGSKSFGGAIFSSPVIYDSLMIVASSRSSENLFAYDLHSGKKVWSKKIADVESPPTMYDSSLYVATVGGDLYRFNPVTGVTLFHEHFPAPLRASPAVDKSLCVVGCDDGNLYGMSSADGKQLWKYDAGSPVWCSASMNDSLIFVGTNAGKLLVLRKNGTLAFDFTTGEKILSMPISDDRRIYFGCNDGNFYAISVVNGALLWKIHTDAPIIASASQTKSQVFFGSFDENLYVVDKSNGKVDQKIDLAGRVRTSPAIYEDYLVVCAENSSVFGFKIK